MVPWETNCYVMLCYVMLCYVMLCYVMLCYVMLCYVMLCYVMLCYVMLCYVMLCYVMLCYVMLCYVMLCYVMLCYSNSLNSYILAELSRNKTGGNGVQVKTEIKTEVYRHVLTFSINLNSAISCCYLAEDDEELYQNL